MHPTEDGRLGQSSEFGMREILIALSLMMLIAQMCGDQRTTILLFVRETKKQKIKIIIRKNNKKCRAAILFS